MQTLATRLLTDNVTALRSGGLPRSDRGLIDALGAILADGTLENAFVALALALPGEADIAREIGEPPVPSLNRGFSAPIKLIANLTADELSFLAARDRDPFNRW